MFALEDLVAIGHFRADRARRSQRYDFLSRKTAFGEDIQHFATHIACGADDSDFVTHVTLQHVSSVFAYRKRRPRAMRLRRRLGFKPVHPSYQAYFAPPMRVPARASAPASAATAQWLRPIPAPSRRRPAGFADAREHRPPRESPACCWTAEWRLSARAGAGPPRHAGRSHKLDRRGLESPERRNGRAIDAFDRSAALGPARRWARPRR